MKTRLRLLGFGLMLCLLAAQLDCGNQPEKANLAQVDRANSVWIAHPLKTYRIVTEVRRQENQRRNDIRVVGGQVTSATVTYWDQKHAAWTGSQPLNEAQAFPFTVPGLFATLKEELSNSDRADIRVVMKGTPPFPQVIVLGPLLQNDGVVPGSKTFITVETFQKFAE